MSFLPRWFALEFLVSVETCNQCVVFEGNPGPAVGSDPFKYPQRFLGLSDFLVDFLRTYENQIAFAVGSPQLEDHFGHGRANRSLLCAGLEVGCDIHGGSGHVFGVTRVQAENDYAQGM
jgi:hypothetical protein